MYNREGYWVTDTERECTLCSLIFPIVNKTMTICNLCNTTRVKSKSPEYKMWARAKSRCTTTGKDFTITLEDINIPEVCPILRVPLVVHKGRSGAYKDSPSLDRIDNSRGYTPDNIQVISQLANQMKGAASKEELLKFAQWITESYSEDN